MLIRFSTVALAALAIFLAVWGWAAEPAAPKKAKPAKAAKTTDPPEKSGDASATDGSTTDAKPPPKNGDQNAKLEEATFGSGCFWCGEAVFEQLKGVKSVVSGFSGGNVPDPSYEQVLTGLTGHAEVIEITFDPAIITFEELLEVFWKSHDPTKLNEQGPDRGTQYRSAIFYHSDEQREIAEKSKQKHMKPPGKAARRIVTEITKFTEFYPAEDYHQDFFKNNPQHDYCVQNVRPKVAKVKKEFKDQLKDAGAKPAKK